MPSPHPCPSDLSPFPSPTRRGDKTEVERGKNETKRCFALQPTMSKNRRLPGQWQRCLCPCCHMCFIHQSRTNTQLRQAAHRLAQTHGGPRAGRHVTKRKHLLRGRYPLRAYSGLIEHEYSLTLGRTSASSNSRRAPWLTAVCPGYS